MPRRRSSSASSGTPYRLMGVLAVIALLVFLAGELFAWATSDRGRLETWHWAHLGQRATVVRIVGKRVQEGLADARVPRACVHEDVVAGEAGGTPRWRIELPHDLSPMQVNYAVTRAVERGGARVTRAHETPGERGALTVNMTIGWPGRPLQELAITRAGRPEEPKTEKEAPAGRVALVLFGLADDLALAKQVLARHETFAAAVPSAGDGHAALRDAARKAGHELVLQVPMEPENYPRVSPGPGTLLVSMSARQIAGELRGALSDAGRVVAVSNYMGSFATQDEPFMTAFYRELQKAKLPFLHVAAVPRAVCRPLAARLGVAYDAPDETLDGEARMETTAALTRAWKVALTEAGERGQAIVLLRVTPLSAKWLDEALGEKSLGRTTLVPLSAVIHQPGTS